MSKPALISTAGARSVPLSQIELELGEFKNPRTDTGLESDDIKDLAASIWDSGLWDPLLILQVLANSKGLDPQDPSDTLGSPHNLTIDGQRRVKALRLLAKQGKIAVDQLIPVNDLPGPKPWEMVIGKSVGDILEMSLRVGLHREGLSSYELLVASQSLASAGRKQTQIASIIGRSDAWVSRMMGAWKVATDALKESLHKGKITDEQFKELATVKVEAQPEAVKHIVDLREKGDRKAAFDASREKAKLPPKAPPTSAPKTARREPAEVQAPATVPPRALAKGDITSGEILSLATVIKPLDQYTKGVVDMARVLQGQISTAQFGKPFKHWLDQVTKKMQAKRKASTKPEKVKDERKAKNGRAGAAVRAATTKPVKPSGGAKSKACSARHHGRCEQAGCACECHHK